MPAMTLDELTRLLDEKEIGDPALVEELDSELPEFADDVRDLDPETALYLVGIASLYNDPIGAYRLLRKSLALVLRTGKLQRLYEQQLSVWKSRREKNQHDLEYLQIVLGVKERRPEPQDKAVEEIIPDEIGATPAED